MDYLKELRDKLGITQQDLADFLCTTRAKLAITETGGRTLSGTPLLWFVDLIKLINKADAADAPPPETLPTTDTNVKTYLQWHLTECQYQATIEKRNLAKLEKTKQRNQYNAKVVALMNEKGEAEPNYEGWRFLSHLLKTSISRSNTKELDELIALSKIKLASWQQQVRDTEAAMGESGL